MSHAQPPPPSGSGPKTRVLFLIPSLVAHGAERQLAELARHMDKHAFDIHLAAWYGPETLPGPGYWHELEGCPGLTLHNLAKPKGLLGYRLALPRLLELMKKIRPHILHSYMDANLPASLVGALTRTPVVWGIRRTSHDLTKLDWISRGLTSLQLRLARFTDLVIFNSEAGLRRHVALGMKVRRNCVIPNGFDLNRFFPDRKLGLRQRQEWGIPESAPLVGIVGRLHPVKAHEAFLEAAALVKKAIPEVHFVCIGSGPQDYWLRLKSLAERRGLGECLLWPGSSQAMVGVYNALTLLALTSTDEGFPNVLGEAMACGIPCVSTDVGDAGLLLGSTGRLVPPGDIEAIAGAMRDLLCEPQGQRLARSRECRERIEDNYSVSTLVRRTQTALTEILQANPIAESNGGHRLHN